MTIVVPVAIPAAGLPIPDPTDRATFTARKLEQIRWANGEYATYSYALGVAAYTNALDAGVSATGANANAVAASASAALAAAYAGAIAWVSGTTYAALDVRYSPANRLLYRRISAGAGTTDPSADNANWSVISAAPPVSLASALVTQAISGGAYALVNTTAQAAATNEILWSNDASNAAWSKTGYTVSPDFAMAPDGTQTADKLVESATNVVHYEVQGVTRATNVPLCFSRRYKAAGRTAVILLMDGTAWTDGAQARFDLVTGVVSSVANVGAGTGVSAAMIFLGDGWWECKLSCTPTVAATTSFRIVTYLSTLASYLGDGTSGVLVGDAQLEAGTVATSRIMTTSAAVARSSGIVAPQRVVLPASPAANDTITVFVGNGIDTNVIDPNGQTLMGISGSLKIDNANPEGVQLQFINSTWKLA